MDCAFGVILCSFDVCNEDASKLVRFGFDEFFCLKLNSDPSNRTELVAFKSIFDKFNSDEKMSLSVKTETEKKVVKHLNLTFYMIIFYLQLFASLPLWPSEVYTEYVCPVFHHKS